MSSGFAGMENNWMTEIKGCEFRHQRCTNQIWVTSTARGDTNLTLQSNNASVNLAGADFDQFCTMDNITDNHFQHITNHERVSYLFGSRPCLEWFSHAHYPHDQCEIMPKVANVITEKRSSRTIAPLGCSNSKRFKAPAIMFRSINGEPQRAPGCHRAPIARYSPRSLEVLKSPVASAKPPIPLRDVSLLSQGKTSGTRAWAHTRCENTKRAVLLDKSVVSLRQKKNSNAL